MRLRPVCSDEGSRTRGGNASSAPTTTDGDDDDPEPEMPITDGDISGVKNKIVRSQLLQKQKKEKAQAKLKKRIARKEAENRGEEVERGEWAAHLAMGSPYSKLGSSNVYSRATRRASHSSPALDQLFFSSSSSSELTPNSPLFLQVGLEQSKTPKNG